ncbi:hypothetical protein PF003_g17789 [Phytophthora fragariae]|nr:hypothetical protein PF003_g17789 [Phytophthora fragariae]
MSGVPSATGFDFELAEAFCFLDALSLVGLAGTGLFFAGLEDDGCGVARRRHLAATPVGEEWVCHLRYVLRLRARPGSEHRALDGEVPAC